MKPTDEERREVAARLRDFERLREVLKESNVCAFSDALGVGYMDWKHICARLADLIEPPFPPCEETEEWLDSIKREGQPKTVRDVIEDIIWTCSTVDIGPNGNVSSSGVDEGIVSTDSLISAWETQLAALIEPDPERTCRWVSVEERLPESAGECIVAYHPCYCACVNEAVTLIGMDSFRGRTAWSKRKYQRVTHWMPKPELPKVVEE